MQYTITELEIESIYRRIMENDIDLQPDFQRGEVWSKQKKVKLIDTILRGWQIPPIHLVETKKLTDEVLDGQQRLAAIRDFMNNGFSIDGSIKPFDTDIFSLDGYKFSQLNEVIQRKFKKYSIRLVRITEYKPEEAAELFYRLNQPTTLTSAEQRNAFIGEARNQVRDLVYWFEHLGANKSTIGFTNSRMAYDDIISKLCYQLEINTLKKKITTNDISDKFRSNEPFSQDIFFKIKNNLEFFMNSIHISQDYAYGNISLNKATLYSWLLFIHRNYRYLDIHTTGKYIYLFEGMRNIVKGKEQTLFNNELIDLFNNIQNKYTYFQSMILLFNQKASMGSTDATSIIIRDIILHLIFEIITSNSLNLTIINLYDEIYNQKQNVLQSIEVVSSRLNWGELI
ncbi:MULTISPECIES: DUF262 domain-containing protein [unclassified Clostridium]|uniref:DUF262 domain-containing protein n=1 Tax=unclassified Clostridium TaxID=2614128 RepID=UPI00207A8406|nr:MULTISPECIES: DUF262 domain-containing protein [unclassified Clostridium]